MAETKIEWTEQTWNPIVGCSIVSPGCTNCYAMKMANRLANNPLTPAYHGTIQPSRGGPVWTGKTAMSLGTLLAPLKRRKPTTYFVNSMGDLFHEDVPDDWIDQVFAVMALCPQHTFQVLTKRADRMRKYMLERWQGTSAMEIAALSIPAGPETGRHHQIEKQAASILEDNGLDDTDNDALWTDDGHLKAMQFMWPLPNVWLGVSAETQHWFNVRWPELARTPAAKRFISFEPLLSQIDITWAVTPVNQWSNGDLNNYPFDYPKHQADWAIVGGESGPNARPMHPNWARGLRDQCEAAETPFFFKQWGLYLHESQDPNSFWDWSEAEDRNALQDWPDGTWFIRLHKKAGGRLLDGREWNGLPG